MPVSGTVVVGPFVPIVDGAEETVVVVDDVVDDVVVAATRGVLEVQAVRPMPVPSSMTIPTAPIAQRRFATCDLGLCSCMPFISSPSGSGSDGTRRPRRHPNLGGQARRLLGVRTKAVRPAGVGGVPKACRSISGRQPEPAAGKGEMGAAENLAVHNRWTAAEDRHDLSHHREFVHEDIEVHLPGSDPIVGIDGYLAMMEANYTGLTDFRVVLDDQFATDDRVVCRWRTSGNQDGELFGLPATGKHIEFAGVSVWAFDNGKARQGWVFPDIAAVMAQLMG
jgi:steroid delta-isomerase-like uncharacterized protein